jgi:hypothetical protein
MQSFFFKKKESSHLRQRGNIHFAKSRPNLHQESREKQNYVGALPPLENSRRESFPTLYFFSHPPTSRGTPTATAIRGEVSFCQVSIFAKSVCQTAGGQFFLFCENLMDVN